jgi:nitric oxide reductase NorQ protein
MTTTIAPTTATPEKEIDDLFPDLTALIYGVAVQEMDATKVPAGLTSLMPASARANVRAKVGTAVPKAKGNKVVNVGALEGVEKYARPNGQDYYARTWGEHSDIEVLRKARGAGQYVLLYGAPGTGKTACVEGAFPDELYTVLGSGDTELSDFIGGYVQTPSGSFEWVDGALVKSAEQGKVLLIDEIGLIDPKVLSAVYGLMDGRKEITITQNPERGTVKAKDGFFVIGATNPNAPGVRLSEALLSRFSIQVEMTTDWVLAKKLGVPATAVSASQNLAKKQANGETSWSPQFRELLAFRDLSELFGSKWAVQNLLASAPEIDRGVVADVFTRVFGEAVLPAKI